MADRLIYAPLSMYEEEALRNELDRRKRERNAAYWAQRTKDAKWLCPDCGMPDSHHALHCPTDTD